jgi:peptide/nickel transport system substrate-binding protein
MASVFKKHTATWGRRGIALGAGAAATALVLTGCASSSVSDTELNGLSIGTTDKVTSLDPAGSYDNGSFAVQNQVFPFLMNTPVGSPDVEPDIATKAEFTSPTTYEVTLKDGLEFANGNKLTSSDVKFSFDRELKINNENGPQSLLANLKSIDTPDDTTVVFNLDHADQTWPQVLSSPAGPIVDEDVFSATKLTSADDIVKGKAFAGQYQISSYKENQLIQYKTNPKYDGLLGKAKTDEVTANYFTKETDLKLAVQKGDVDVAYRSLTPTDISDLRKDDDLKVTDGPGGETATWSSTSRRSRSAPVRTTPTRRRPSPCARPPLTWSTAPPWRRRSTTTPSPRCTRWCRTASPVRSSRSRTCTATATAAPTSPRRRRPSPTPVSPARCSSTSSTRPTTTVRPRTTSTRC